jgi:5-methylcytosine-specific restriction enzyme A
MNNYERNPIVTEYAKRWANGICQLCEKPSPFVNKNGLPHLHTHHIEWLSRGGEDSIENVAAIINFTLSIALNYPQNTNI